MKEKPSEPGLSPEEFKELRAVITRAICDLLLFQYRICSRYDAIFKKFKVKEKDRCEISDDPLTVALDLLQVCPVHRGWAVKKWHEIPLDLDEVRAILAIRDYGNWVNDQLRQFDCPKSEMN